MLALLLDLVYLLLLIAATPWLVWQAVRKGKYREGFAAKLLGSVPARAGNRPCIWLHAVSVGEVNLLGPLVAEIERRWPGVECVISATTMTGMALARQRFAGRSVFYAPLDFSWAVRRALGRIRPDLLILAELELWPNWIAAARRQGARVAVVNGRLSDRSLRGYLRIRPLAAAMFRKLDLVLAQTDEYAERFRAAGAGPEAVHVTGSIKFDGAESDRDHPETARLRRLAGIAADDVVLLAGSTQEPEEQMALEAFCRFRAAYPRLRLILVPRHPDRFDSVAQLLAASGVPWQRRSTLDSHEPDPAARVLLVDRIGELRAWWGTAQLGFVGGSLGTRGGQNMIEPAAYGCAVSFGPNTQNFRDVVALLLAADAAVVVRDAAEFESFVGRALVDPTSAAALGERARLVVAGQLGATRRTVELLEGVLGAKAGLRRRWAA